MDGSPSSSCLPDKALLEDLKHKISSGEVDQERFAAKELRKLAKMSSVNRFCIGEIGVIPFLIRSLSSADSDTQTHAVTALLNSTIKNEGNKQVIIVKGLDMVLEVMKKGSLEARENAVALLFNLSRCEAFRTAIGACIDVFGAVVSLLKDGSPRGKKDAAAALYCLLQEVRHGRALAVCAGAVDALLEIAQDSNLGLIDESLSVLLRIASHQEGRCAIGRQAVGIKTLINLLRNGSDSNKEYACALLLVLCQHDYLCSDTAHVLGAHDLLVDLSAHGNERLKRKASKVLEFLE